MTTLDDLYAAIGYGELTAASVVSKLNEFYRKENEGKITVGDEEKLGTKQRISSGVLVKGYDDFLIRLSKCCNPVPGDKIVGYISRGRGVTIHRQDCVNLKTLEKERFIEASWPNKNNNFFVASLIVTGENRSGLFVDVVTIINNYKYPIKNVNARVDKDYRAVICISVEIKNIDDLEALIRKISTVKGVYEVTRTNN